MLARLLTRLRRLLHAHDWGPCTPDPHDGRDYSTCLTCGRRARC